MTETDELERLRNRVAQLEGLLGVCDDMVCRYRLAFDLQAEQGRLLGLLMNRHVMRFDEAHDLLYGDRPEDQQPGLPIVRVQVHKLRKKLKPHDIEVTTLAGDGWALVPEMKRRVCLKLTAFESDGVQRLVMVPAPSEFDLPPSWRRVA
jgi:hypothetical protein